MQSIDWDKLLKIILVFEIDFRKKIAKNKSFSNSNKRNIFYIHIKIDSFQIENDDKWKEEIGV